MTIKEYEPFWLSSSNDTNIILVLPIIDDVDETDILKMIRENDIKHNLEYVTLARYPKEDFEKIVKQTFPEKCDWFLVRQFEKEEGEWKPLVIPREEHDGKKFIILDFTRVVKTPEIN